MKNWKKDRNFRKLKNDDGTSTYIITVDSVDVEVSAEIYKEYAKIGYKMEKMEFSIKCERFLQDANGKAVRDENGIPVMLPEREVSLDKLIKEDWDYQSLEPLPEDVVLDGLEIQKLHNCLDLLCYDERALIDALFFDGLTEREYADKLGLSKTAIHARKNKILKKLKSF